MIKMEKAIQWMVLIKGTQAKILAELKRVKGYQDANNKSFKSVRKQTRRRLDKVETLRANWIQTNGGALFISTTIIRIFNGINYRPRIKPIG